MDIGQLIVDIILWVPFIGICLLAPAVLYFIVNEMFHK
jgi:hypothetical protein